MIGKVDRQIKLTVVYAPNGANEDGERFHDIAQRVVPLATGEQARFCNPKYWESSGIEADAKKVWVLPGSPNTDAILAGYREAGIPAAVAGDVAPPAAPPAPSPATVEPLTPPTPDPTPPQADLPPWKSKRFTPGRYVELYPKAQTETAKLARRYVEAGRPEG